jgi:hypothetical protein
MDDAKFPEQVDKLRALLDKYGNLLETHGFTGKPDCLAVASAMLIVSCQW